MNLNVTCRFSVVCTRLIKISFNRLHATLYGSDISCMWHCMARQSDRVPGDANDIRCDAIATSSKLGITSFCLSLRKRKCHASRNVYTWLRKGRFPDILYSGQSIAPPAAAVASPLSLSFRRHLPVPRHYFPSLLTCTSLTSFFCLSLRKSKMSCLM